MKQYYISIFGRIERHDQTPITHSEISADDVAVPHLEAHVETFELDEKDSVKVLIQYSCHCWTCGWDANLHAGQIRIMDHARPRAFDPVRYDASVALKDLMRNLPKNRIYVTQTDRNYGVYNATMIDADGARYTAYFTLRKAKGRYDRIRHQFRLFVESAYPKVQPEPGMKTSFRAIVGKAREGKMVKYRR